MTAGGVAMIVFTIGATGATTLEITGAMGAVTVEMIGAIGAVTVDTTGATTVETTGVNGAVTVETTELTAPATAEVTGAEETVVDPTERDAEGTDPPEVDAPVTPILNVPKVMDAVSPLPGSEVAIDVPVNVVNACNKRTSTFKA
jgi:hypothetical protein